MKKGFTLIELLGTIVILGLIALVATPPIVNLVKKSNQKISDANLRLIYKAGEDYIDEFQNDYTLTKDIKICLPIQKLVDNGNLKESFIKQQKVNTGNSIQFTVGDKMKLTYKMKLYDASCSKEVSGGGGSEATPTSTPIPVKAYTEGDIIYYNPETNKKCTSGEVNTTTNAKTGCLKWNVITMGDTTGKTDVEIMLDHNTTATVAWNSSNTNTEMKEVATALQTDVATWNATVKSTARLITGQEVANIVKNTSWTTGGLDISLSTQPWLYQKLSSSNTNEEPYGYWTSTAHSSDSNITWNVDYDANLNMSHVANAGHCGVRPVITISKSAIS